MSDKAARDHDAADDVLVVDFVFVPYGAPEPVEWQARHPDWFKVPARLILPQRGGHRLHGPMKGVAPVRDVVEGNAGPKAGHDASRRIPSGNPTHVDRFFNELHDPLAEAARMLGILPAWLMGLSSYESGWLNEHNSRLNNPLGMTRGGGSNLAFGSLAEAIAYWVQLYGHQVREATSAEDFAARLQGRLGGRPEPGWRRYNTQNSGWERQLLDQIATVERRMPLWRAGQ